MTLFLFSVLLAVVVSFFCSLSEATVLSLTPGEVAQLNQSHPRTGKIWNRFKSSIDRPIAVILILNTFAHTVGATIAGAQFDKLWGDRGILIFSLSFTMLILLFTEILPKTLGVLYRRSLALPMGFVLSFLVKVLAPIIALTQWINRPFTGGKNKPALPLEELRSLASQARLSNLIGRQEEKIIQEATRLSQNTAGRIMVPAEEIVFFGDNESLEDLVVKAHLDPHTRFPICRGRDLNKVRGYVNFKELLFSAQNNPANPSVEGIIRPVKFIAPEVPLHLLLREFIQEHIHLGIIRDERGKTLGLITLEDLIEEILGDIEDEFDRLPKMRHSLAGGTWIVGGGVPMWDLADLFGDAFRANPETLSEWLFARYGRKPNTGDSFSWNDWKILIRRVRRGKIFEVLILPKESPPPVGISLNKGI